MSARGGPLFITTLFKIPLRISFSPIHQPIPPPPPKKEEKKRRTGNLGTDFLALTSVVGFHVLSILNVIVRVLLLYAEWNFNQSFVHE